MLKGQDQLHHRTAGVNYGVLTPASLHFLVHGDNLLYEVIAAGVSWHALRWLNFEAPADDHC
ncbi:MAG: hypothetical protein ACI9OJ_001647 [Myxococcota bacterium]|jgi:hypothetical protein